MVAAENAIYKELSVTKSVHIRRTWCLPSLQIVLDNCLEGGRRMPVDFCGLLIEVSKLTMAPVGEIQCFWFRLWTFTTCSTGILDWIRISRLYGTHMKAVLDILVQVQWDCYLCVLTHFVNFVHARGRARREFGLFCVILELDDYWPFCRFYLLCGTCEYPGQDFYDYWTKVTVFLGSSVEAVSSLSELPSDYYCGVHNGKNPTSSGIWLYSTEWMA